MELAFEYSENNHYRWGWGDEWFNSPDPTKPFNVKLGHVTREVGTFREECIHTANLIANKATKPMIVGLSGGSDSQMVCLALRELKVPFKVVIVKMYDKNNTLVNEFDIKVAYEFCQKFNIDFIEHEVNVHEFYNTIGIERARKYSMTNWSTIIQTSTMDYVGKDYCYIMAGGDVKFELIKQGALDKTFESIPYSNVTVPLWIEGPQPVMRHMIEMEYEGSSKFYLYTPELISAYLNDPVIADLINTADVVYQPLVNAWFPKTSWMWWRLFNLFIKPMMMYRNWPELIRTRKWTGFEGIPAEDRKIYEKMLDDAENGQSGNQTVAITIKELLEYINTPHDHCLTAVRKLNSIY